MGVVTSEVVGVEDQEDSLKIGLLDEARKQEDPQPPLEGYHITSRASAIPGRIAVSAEQRYVAQVEVGRLVAYLNVKCHYHLFHDGEASINDRLPFRANGTDCYHGREKPLSYVFRRALPLHVRTAVVPKPDHVRGRQRWDCPIFNHMEIHKPGDMNILTRKRSNKVVGSLGA
ncbi:hypothetical protein J6590_079219 [Homalodisca vitripennis]|nr:hypothetical protein J6590_079219 [Homalodisca vitripennis]